MANDFTPAAIWPAREGMGHISSSPVPGTAPRLDTRIGPDGDLATSEDLLSAALAARYAAALSVLCQNQGTPVESIDADARITLGRDSLGYFVQAIHVDLRARVPGLDEAGFSKLAALVRDRCPIARALAVSEVTLATHLD